MLTNEQKQAGLAKITDIKKQLGMGATLEPRQAETERKPIVLTEYEPDTGLDPFENWEAYQAACAAEKRPIPQALYNCHNYSPIGMDQE